ncbi:GumC family protein [Pseudohoeflea suaedae]|uniref:GumC family protein n=1 Tax=Pseudohoeflea suaedae TaxID=877384 RepID=UPI001304822F|nr:GumC family protein [Pseudohoeflea suaedae]
MSRPYRAPEPEYERRAEAAPRAGPVRRSYEESVPRESYPRAERYYDDDDDRPLVDIGVLVASVWRHRRLIVSTTVIGAIAGVLIALSTPNHYYAETKMFIDPREIRVTEDDLRNQNLSTEAMIALADSQIQILSSNHVLSQVVDKLNLIRDPEFNGSATAGGIAGGIALIRQLLSGSEVNDEMETEAIDTLGKALAISRDPQTFVINVGVTTRDADKSTLIANTLVDTYLASEDAAQSGLMERTSEALDSRLDSLRSDLNAAERAVENFRAENDLVGVGGELIDDKQVVALNQQRANALAQKVSVRVKAENLAKADVNDVIDGAFPEEFLSANLLELRKQYSQAKSNADSLASSLGPLHPKYVAADSSLASLRGQIRSELRRIVASSQAELQRAVETEQELSSQLAVAKTKSLDNSEELVTLRELERTASATREIYESFLKRSRETSERGNLNPQNVRVISAAEPPLDPAGPSRKLIAIAGAILGTLAGVGIALALGFLEILRGLLPDDGPGAPRGGRRSPYSPAPDSGAASHVAARREQGHVAAATATGSTAASVTAAREPEPVAAPEWQQPEVARAAPAPTPQPSQAPQPAQPPQPAHKPQPAFHPAYPQEMQAQPEQAYPVAYPAPPAYPAYQPYPLHPMMVQAPQPHWFHGAPWPHPAAYAQPAYPAMPQHAQPYAPQAGVAQPHAPAQPVGAAAAAADRDLSEDHRSDEEIRRIRSQMRELRHRIDRRTHRRSA